MKNNNVGMNLATQKEFNLKGEETDPITPVKVIKQHLEVISLSATPTTITRKFRVLGFNYAFRLINTDTTTVIYILLNNFAVGYVATVPSVAGAYNGDYHLPTPFDIEAGQTVSINYDAIFTGRYCLLYGYYVD